MKKLNLRGISMILSEKDLKNVLGGSSASNGCDPTGDNCSGDCNYNGLKGKCKSSEISNYLCYCDTTVKPNS
jgi:hypothetical protein